jgi:hypothetical protein
MHIIMRFLVFDTGLIKDEIILLRFFFITNTKLHLVRSMTKTFTLKLYKAHLIIYILLLQTYCDMPFRAHFYELSFEMN